MSSAKGERGVRLPEQISRIRALLDGLEMSANMGVPLSENAQAVADSAIRLVATAARHDTYLRVEEKKT